MRLPYAGTHARAPAQKRRRRDEFVDARRERLTRRRHTALTVYATLLFSSLFGTCSIVVSQSQSVAGHEPLIACVGCATLSSKHGPRGSGPSWWYPARRGHVPLSHTRPPPGRETRNDTGHGRTHGTTVSRALCALL